VDQPPNCVSCKFEFEASPRIAKGNSLVTRENWQSIRCDVCHAVSKGIASSEIAWWDQATGEYEAVASSTALCEKCHADTEVLRHRRDLGNAAHAGFRCTNCHDAHSTTTSCTQAGCHTDIGQAAGQATPPATPSVGHQAGSQGFCGGPQCHASATAAAQGTRLMHDGIHAVVTCVACHDASGLEVGPLEDGSAWVTWRKTELLGRENNEPYQSHAITRQVDCLRCHNAGNPWGLVELAAPK
jgi:hypothetical protein